MAIFGPYSATVAHIHDGDTFTLDIDLGPSEPFDLGFGFSVAPAGRVRLDCRVYSINAPELVTAAGKAALAFLQTFLHVGDKVQVWSFGWDKYGGRFDGRVLLPDGTNVGTKMVDGGHAVLMPPGQP